MSLYEPAVEPAWPPPQTYATESGLECPKCGAWTEYLSRVVPSTGQVVRSWPGGEDGRCVPCKGKHEAATAAFRESERRRLVQAAAGIPPRYRHLSFRRADRVHVQPDAPSERFTWTDKSKAHDMNKADLEAWQATVRAAGEGHLGVPATDRRVLKAVAAWKPTDGSMWVEGTPGTGKTAAVCARVNDIVAVPLSFRCQCVSCRAVNAEEGLLTSECKGSHVRSPPVRVVGGIAAMFTTEADLVAGMQAKRMGGVKDSDGKQEQDIATRARRVGILILDELGGQNEVKDWILDVINSVINERYNSGLPTLYTSNVALTDPLVAKKYGERFVSRVKDSVGDRRYVLNVQWRTT